MSFTTWTPHAVWSESTEWQATLWRMVEAQHVASTMKIVDSRDEQDILEALVEGSKPAAAAHTEALHYLLASPFRYPPRQSSGSRFRSPTDPGVFYGAGAVRTAAAELGYWRWRFLRDAVDLTKLDPVAHTAFRIKARSQAIDLRQAPFDQDALSWQHPSSYQATQAFGQIARTAGIGAILYQSVRDPQPGWCAALLTPAAFVRPRPEPGQQTWWLAVYPEQVVWRRDQETLSFIPAA